MPPKLSYLGLSLAFANSGSLLRVGRGHWLPEARLVVNKRTRSMTRSASQLYLSNY